MTDEALLEAHALVKTYGGRDAVAGVDLRVCPGDVHALVGPNGAGKTTLLRMLLGLARPDSGTLRLLGQPFLGGVAALHDRVAGYVDAPSFYPDLTGHENLTLLALLDRPRAPAAYPTLARASVAAVLDDVGLTSHGRVRVAAYSTGMRQRLALAAALLRAPRLLLLDEPTSSLDPAGARAVRELLGRLAASGVGIVLSSHDMAEVEGLCTSLSILNAGRVVFSGTAATLRARSPREAHRLRTDRDEDARALASERGVDAVPAADGLDVSASEPDLDAYMIALGAGGIAVRALARQELSLESLVTSLTEPGASDDSPRDEPPRLPPPAHGVTTLTWHGVRQVVAVEARKLADRSTAVIVLTLCLVAPVGFALGLELTGRVPEDTLFGRWALTSGFAVPLVVLGFAPALAFPALASVVAGDVFSSEDRYGTWSTLLTRSRTRSELFVGKAVTAFAFTLAVTVALGVASAFAGVLVVGRQPLLGLSGTELPVGGAAASVALAWVSIVAPAFGFTALAILVSVATRSSVAGVGLPVVLGFAMDLCSFVPAADPFRGLLLTSGFTGWHGLFASPRYLGPLGLGVVVGFAYTAGCLVAARVIARRRDMGV